MIERQGSPSLENLFRLLRVRCLLLALVVGAALGVHFLLELTLPLSALGGLILAMLAVTVLTALRHQRSGAPASGQQLAMQLVIDVMGLAALLYFTGGWTNPLVSLFLVPIAVAVVMLPRRMAWSITVFTIIVYSLLTTFYQPIVMVEHTMEHTFTLHLAGMWLTFVLSATLITYFGTTMVATLRKRDQALAAEREENLRNEQIIGVATLAAGTAHELSTPLSSIAVVAGELAETAPEHLRNDLRLLLDQVTVCRETLGRLRDTAGGTERAAPVRLDSFLQALRERLVLLRPRADLQLEMPPAAELPYIQPDPTLHQAVLNLLDNAAAAAHEQLTCRLTCSGAMLQLEILDDGPGFSPQASRQQGDSLRAAGQGMGMGMLLANATIERLGGQVSVSNRTDAPQGARVLLTLPLQRLQKDTA